MEEMRKKVTRDETLKKLEEMGVQFTEEDSPFGKIENASMMGAYRPIYINVKKGLLCRVTEAVKKFFRWKY